LAGVVFTHKEHHNMADKAVNLTAFLPVDSFDIEIQSVTGEGTGWHVSLAGPSHPATVASAETIARRALRKSAEIEAAQVNNRKYKVDEREPANVRRENVESVVSRIIDWTPVDIGSGPITFSKETATDLLLKPEMGWALVQIAEALAGDAAFIKRSASA
jgi:hypothetical protein